MKKLTISPKELSWKRRPPVVSKKAVPPEPEGSKDDLKEPRDYIFQSNRLGASLAVLEREHRIFPNRNYVSFILLPEDSEIDSALESYYLDRYSLQSLGVEAYGPHSRIFFEVSNWQLFLDALKLDLIEFKKFAEGKIPEVRFVNKRITLIHDFSLQTPSRADFVPLPKDPVIFFSIEIREIKPETVSKEKIESIAAAVGLRVNVSVNGLIRETDILNQLNSSVIEPKTLEAFLSQLSDIPEVKSIYLDKTVTIEHNGISQQIKEEVPVIEDVLDSSPIVCVIDTGVEANHFTEKVFLEGEGFCADEALGNPQTDPLNHGTAVTCRILYGHTLETNIVPERKTLLPLSKIFPVKLLATGSGNSLKCDYKEIFDVDGDLAEAVKRLGIKLINLSVNVQATRELQLPDKLMSKEAAIIDNFSKKLGVIVVISAGNVTPEMLEEYLAENGKDGIEKIHQQMEAGYFFRVLPPADFLSGISVGSCWSEKISKGKFSPSWFSRILPSIAKKAPLKPDCLALGGDYQLKIKSNPPEVKTTHQKSLLAVGKSNSHIGTDDQIFLDCGTSYAAPHVTRALAIAAANYPQASVETIKGLFLHRAVSDKSFLNKESDDDPSETIVFTKAFQGVGLFSKKDELAFLSGQTNEKMKNEITYAIEGQIRSEKVLYYDIDLSEYKKMMQGKEDHKLRLQLSVSYLPALPSDYNFSKPISFTEANQIHLAACLHSPKFEVVKMKKRKNFNNERPEIIELASSEWVNHGLLSWTLDYYGMVQAPFTSKEKIFSVNDFEKKIGDQGSIRLSIRCHVRDAGLEAAPQKFSAILSIQDYGASAKTTAKARAKLEVEL